MKPTVVKNLELIEMTYFNTFRKFSTRKFRGDKLNTFENLTAMLKDYDRLDYLDITSKDGFKRNDKQALTVVYINKRYRKTHLITISTDDILFRNVRDILGTKSMFAYPTQDFRLMKISEDECIIMKVEGHESLENLFASSVSPTEYNQMVTGKVIEDVKKSILSNAS